jgi:hypothetical protein
LAEVIYDLYYEYDTAHGSSDVHVWLLGADYDFLIDGIDDFVNCGLYQIV